MVEARAKELEDLRVALLACMEEAKATIDAAFAKGGAGLSEALPEDDPAAFLEWLRAEVGQFEKLLDSVSDLGAYGAALAIARTFQAASCDHVKKIGRVPRKFPSLENVHEAARDPLCKNVVVWFLKRFWMQSRNRALAFDVTAAGTHEVFFGIFVMFGFLFILLFLTVFTVLLGVTTLG